MHALLYTETHPQRGERPETTYFIADLRGCKSLGLGSTLCTTNSVVFADQLAQLEEVGVQLHSQRPLRALSPWRPGGHYRDPIRVTTAPFTP
ncbi:MAG: hypothetical protein OXR66_03780 [Candidatus Woesearchaeota archaeon]|nr:hypothetical protein [Candidatus Woesearchaeota archaeon]